MLISRHPTALVLTIVARHTQLASEYAVNWELQALTQSKEARLLLLGNYHVALAWKLSRYCLARGEIELTRTNFVESNAPRNFQINAAEYSKETSS